VEGRIACKENIEIRDNAASAELQPTIESKLYGTDKKKKWDVGIPTMGVKYTKKPMFLEE